MSDKPEERCIITPDKRVVNPSGRPVRKMNRCIALECGAEIEPPHMFCKDDFRRLPKHLADALHGEKLWLRESRQLSDFATRTLIAACIQRVALERARIDVPFAERLRSRVEVEAEGKLVQ